MLVILNCYQSIISNYNIKKNFNLTYSIKFKNEFMIFINTIMVLNNTHKYVCILSSLKI